jgi:inosine/xanthosine triphosphate pyrophosphatase family protein
MARIVEDNKIMLRKLQGAASCYSIDRWNQDDKKKKKLVKMICRNSDRFLKNPYFLCNGLPNTATLGTANSEHSFYGFGGSHFQDDKRSLKKRSSYTSLDPNY